MLARTRVLQQTLGLLCQVRARRPESSAWTSPEWLPVVSPEDVVAGVGEIITVGVAELIETKRVPPNCIVGRIDIAIVVEVGRKQRLLTTCSCTVVAV